MTGHWEIRDTKTIRSRKEGDDPDTEVVVSDGDLILVKRGGKMIEKVLFFRCFLGWHILLKKKQTKRRREFNLRVWRKR